MGGATQLKKRKTRTKRKEFREANETLLPSPTADTYHIVFRPLLSSVDRIRDHPSHGFLGVKPAEAPPWQWPLEGESDAWERPTAPTPYNFIFLTSYLVNGPPPRPERGLLLLEATAAPPSFLWRDAERLPHSKVIHVFALPPPAFAPARKGAKDYFSRGKIVPPFSHLVDVTFFMGVGFSRNAFFAERVYTHFVTCGCSQ